MKPLAGSRLFSTLVLMGAALAGGAVIACSGDDGSPSTGSASSASTPDDAGSDADAQPDPSASSQPGWPTTK
ncbi:MAG TPA: hypothetical protein VIF62_03710 [Labilithrix sp.]